MGRTTTFKSIIRRLQHVDKIEEGLLDSLNEQEKEILEALHEEGLLNEALEFLNDLNVEKEYDKALKMFIDSQKSKPSFKWGKWVKYAAILIGFVSTGYYFLENGEQNRNPEYSEKGIKLKMAAGTVKIIEEGQNQQLVNAVGEVLGQQDGNILRYNGNGHTTELVYNELEIPLGMIFNVELSDGTFVHLNSGTKIRYPIAFLEGQKREVFIEGEAYFEVSKDQSRPFIVHAGQMEVKVLGTKFNISSYEEDTDIKTVLVEGSVQMGNTTRENETVKLTPGTMGSWHKETNRISMEEVDLDLYTGWLKGELVFRNMSFSSMEKKLERSYDVSIINNNASLALKLFNARFNVEIESIEEVLKAISEIHHFTYSIKGEKIVIN